MPMSRLVLVALIALVTAGCGLLYKQPIYQGNLIEKSAVEQLQVGMDKQQVMTLLGSPSIADPFHHQRWDYTSTQRTDRRGRDQPQQAAASGSVGPGWGVARRPGIHVGAPDCPG